MIRLLGVSGLVLCMTAVPAAAKEKKPVDPNQRICRSVTNSGSRFSDKVCHTRAQWDEIAAENERIMDRSTGRNIRTAPTTVN